MKILNIQGGVNMQKNMIDVLMQKKGINAVELACVIEMPLEELHLCLANMMEMPKDKLGVAIRFLNGEKDV